jgi:hypothetical protein
MFTDMNVYMCKSISVFLRVYVYIHFHKYKLHVCMHVSICYLHTSILTDLPTYQKKVYLQSYR